MKVMLSVSMIGLTIRMSQQVENMRIIDLANEEVL